ncbi:MAG: glycosyltransferase family 2 protein, partial [Chloroflexi bacterium]|nr:glycosyltransferase family 2 protein [Chloroflexota bacterium]
MNRPALLEQALASIRRVEGPDLEVEIIVSDNEPSTDVEAITHAFHGAYVRATTPGPGAARNAGALAATSEYLTFLDDDDLWLPTHVRTHLKLLEAHPRLAAVIGQNVGVDMSLKNVGPPHPMSLLDPADIFRSLLAVVPQIGSVVVRHSAWN